MNSRGCSASTTAGGTSRCPRKCTAQSTSVCGVPDSSRYSHRASAGPTDTTLELLQTLLSFPCTCFLVRTMFKTHYKGQGMTIQQPGGAREHSGSGGTPRCASVWKALAASGPLPAVRSEVAVSSIAHIWPGLPAHRHSLAPAALKTPDRIPFSMDPRTFTQKVNETLTAAQELASEHSHQQLSPLHVAIVLFEDPEGVARAAVAKQVCIEL